MPVDNVEALREACALGDVDSGASILQRGVIDVNDRHAMNGWTALHWASKRGHSTIVDLLLKYGADPSIANFKEEVPASVASSDAIARRLGASDIPEKAAENDPTESPSFVPNYIRHPAFPYVGKEETISHEAIVEKNNNNNSASHAEMNGTSRVRSPLPNENSSLTSP